MEKEYQKIKEELHVKHDNKTVGRLGESLAEQLLLSRGYEILAKNFACKYGEIDLIARNRGRLSFVEVKTRLSGTYGLGREAVDYKKREHIRNVANFYLMSEKPAYDTIDFQVVEITGSHITGLRF